MQRFVTGITALFLLFSGQAMAQVDLDSAPGEAHIKLSLPYAKVQVNGEPWEDTEFAKNGKLLIVRGLDRSISNELILEASEDGYDSVTIQLGSKKEFRKKRKKRVVSFIAKKSAKFKKTVRKERPTEDEKPAAAKKPVPKGKVIAPVKTPIQKKDDMIKKAPGKDAFKKKMQPTPTPGGAPK